MRKAYNKTMYVFLKEVRETFSGESEQDGDA